MRVKLTKKHLDYLVLLFAAVIAIIIAILNSANKSAVTLTVLAFSAFYLLWGIIHHHAEGNLRFEIVMEYLLFAVLGSFLIIDLL